MQNNIDGVCDTESAYCTLTVHMSASPLFSQKQPCYATWNLDAAVYMQTDLCLTVKRCCARKHPTKLPNHQGPSQHTPSRQPRNTPHRNPQHTTRPGTNNTLLREAHPNKIILILACLLQPQGAPFRAPQQLPNCATISGPADAWQLCQAKTRFSTANTSFMPLVLQIHPV